MMLQKQDGFWWFTHSLVSWPFLGFAAYLAGEQPLNPAIDSGLLPWWRHFTFLVRKVACNYKRCYRVIKVWRIINYASFFRQIELLDTTLVPITFSAVQFLQTFSQNLAQSLKNVMHRILQKLLILRPISRSEHLQNEGVSDLWR